MSATKWLLLLPPFPSSSNQVFELEVRMPQRRRWRALNALRKVKAAANPSAIHLFQGPKNTHVVVSQFQNDFQPAVIDVFLIVKELPD